MDHRRFHGGGQSAAVPGLGLGPAPIRAGRSSRSFWEEGLFEPVREGMAAGDMLLIQFGHNDEKDDERHTDPDTTFPEHLMRYVRAAREKGALPVLLTPVSRRFFSDVHPR